MSDHEEQLIETALEARRDGRHGDAERTLLEVIETTRRTGQTLHLIRALKALADALRDVGQEGRALPLYEEAVALSRLERNDLLLAHTVRHLGDLHRHGDRLAEAERCYDEALSIYRAAPSPPALDFANALRPAALLKERQDDAGSAQQLWSEAKALYQQAGIQAAVDECARHLAKLG